MNTNNIDLFFYSSYIFFFLEIFVLIYWIIEILEIFNISQINTNSPTLCIIIRVCLVHCSLYQSNIRFEISKEQNEKIEKIKKYEMKIKWNKINKINTICFYSMSKYIYCFVWFVFNVYYSRYEIIEKKVQNSKKSF